MICLDAEENLLRLRQATIERRSRKLIDADTEDFYCICCLAEYIGCTEQDLIEKIQEFKEQGCTLFL